MQKFGDIEFGHIHATLAIAGHLSVNPHKESTLHTIEAQENAFTIPCFRQAEMTTIRTCRIAFYFRGITFLRLIFHIRRINFERKTCTYINRCTITVYFPVSRHRKIHPGGIVEIGLIEIQGSFLRSGNPMKFPSTIQTHASIAHFFFVRHILGTSRHTINLQNMMILPNFCP